jgi:predicted nucleic acid-binding protein
LRRGSRLPGTLGILRLSARRGLFDIAETVAKLKRTNFRYRPEMMDDLLSEFSGDV